MLETKNYMKPNSFYKFILDSTLQKIQDTV